MSNKKKKSEFKTSRKPPKDMKVFGSKERKKLAKFYKEAAKPALGKRIRRKGAKTATATWKKSLSQADKWEERASRSAKKVKPFVRAIGKSATKKSLARKVLSKLGTPGKIAVGASFLYDYAKTKQKGKKGCGPGMRKVTKNGKTYCAPISGSKKSSVSYKFRAGRRGMEK